MIRLANPEAKRVLWKNHQSIADYIIAEYKALLPAVRVELANAQSRLYILFNGWTTPNNRYALTGIWVHHLNLRGRVVDYMLALLVQLSRHFGTNYAEVIGDVLADFHIIPERLGYFIIDNKPKNNITLEALSKRFNFNKDKRRGRCAYHILNLVA